MSRRAAIAGTLALILFAGCASYDRASTENTIVEDLSPQVKELTGAAIKSARCPAEVKIEDGYRFDCTATLKNGDEVTVDGRVAGEDVRVEIAPEVLLEVAGAS